MATTSFEYREVPFIPNWVKHSATSFHTETHQAVPYFSGIKHSARPKSNQSISPFFSKFRFPPSRNRATSSSRTSAQTNSRPSLAAGPVHQLLHPVVRLHPTPGASRVRESPRVRRRAEMARGSPEGGWVAVVFCWCP